MHLTQFPINPTMEIILRYPEICPVCFVRLSSRESIDWCNNVSCTATEKRGPTPHQVKEFTDADRMCGQLRPRFASHTPQIGKRTLAERINARHDRAKELGNGSR